MANQRSRRAAVDPLVLCLVLALVLICGQAATVGAQQAATSKPNIVIIWGDDIGQSNISAYSRGLMGYQTPNIDRVATRRHDVHRLLRRAELHGRPGLVHHRPVRLAHRPDQGRPAGRYASGCRRKIRRSPSCSSRKATPPASSARTTWATAMSTCPPSTASTSSTAISTTSTPRKSRSCRTTRRTRRSVPSLGHAACWTARPRTRTIRRLIRASAKSASRCARTPAR